MMAMPLLRLIDSPSPNQTVVLLGICLTLPCAGNRRAPIFSHHGSAEYDSLQSAFTTRFQHDSTFQLAYTFSKTYADTLLKVSNGGESCYDPFNLKKWLRAESPQPAAHLLGQPALQPAHLQNMDRYVRTALGSWTVDSIVSSRVDIPLRQPSEAFRMLRPVRYRQRCSAQRPNLVPGQPCRNPSFANFQWINPNRYTERV